MKSNILFRSLALCATMLVLLVCWTACSKTAAPDTNNSTLPDPTAVLDPSAHHTTEDLAYQLLELLDSKGYDVCAATAGHMAAVDPAVALAALDASGQLEIDNPVMTVVSTALQTNAVIPIVATFEVVDLASGDVHPIELVYVPYTDQLHPAGEEHAGTSGAIINTFSPNEQTCRECTEWHGRVHKSDDCFCHDFQYCLRDGETCPQTKCKPCFIAMPGEVFDALCPNGLPFVVDPSAGPRPIPQVQPGEVFMSF